MDYKNWIQGPLDPTARLIGINGVPVTVVADLPEGGYVQIVNGDNPVAQAMPGPQLLKGSLLVAIPPNIADQLRPEIRKQMANESKVLGSPFAVDGAPVAPNAFGPRLSDEQPH